jgi:CubicO group peptidase (beta-lactamase class C family)
MPTAKMIFFVAVAALAGLLACLTVGPRPLRPDGRTSGGAHLARQLRQVLGAGHRTAAVAVIEGGRAGFAGMGGADEHTGFEIGSVGKVFTGMLLADLADAGTVRLDQQVGGLVPGTPLAGCRVTLSELSQHRSGLPRDLEGPGAYLRKARIPINGADPYVEDVPEVLAGAAAFMPQGGAEPVYSNLGVAVLGDALALRTGVPFPQLVRQRLFGPLGMAETVVATRAAEVPARRAVGMMAGTGRAVAPWTGSGWAPAGAGMWSTAHDLALLAGAVLSGGAPGSGAAQPTAAFDGVDRIGLVWLTGRHYGRELTWHEGATGGFGAFIGIDRGAGRAVVVLSASNEIMTDAAMRLLAGRVA